MMACPPDCLVCKVGAGYDPVLKNELHHACGHWASDWTWSARYVVILCAMFWNFGRAVGRAEGARAHDRLE